MERNIKDFLLKENQEELAKGFNVDKLKEKYHPDKIEMNIEEIIQNNPDVFKNIRNEAVLDNMKEFQKEKE